MNDFLNQTIHVGFTVLDNGIPSNRTNVRLTPGPGRSRHSFSLNHIAPVGIWKNAATYVRLHLDDVQLKEPYGFQPYLVTGHSTLEIEHGVVGQAPWCAWMGPEWPQAPIGVLHYPQWIEFDQYTTSPGMHVFSLITDKVIVD